MASLSPQILQTLRQRGGVVSAAELQAALGVSQPTVSRALAPLLQSGQVHKVGAARSQRYVLPRTVRAWFGAWCEVPLVPMSTLAAPLAGPALIVEPHSTVVLEPGWTARPLPGDTRGGDVSSPGSSPSTRMGWRAATPIGCGSPTGRP